MFPFRFVFLLILASPALAAAQQAMFKDNTLTWNNQELARLRITDQESELPGFELIKADGSLLLTATPSNRIPTGDEPPGETIYAFQFQGVAEPVYLALNPSTAQEDLGKLMTSMDLINEEGIDPLGVHHLRKKHGLVAPETTAPALVSRDRSGPLTLRRTGDIFQADQLIGRVRVLENAVGGLEHYAIDLPGGQRVATIAFSGGDGALEFTVETAADNFWHPVRRENAVSGKSEPGADPNAGALLRILPWLVQKGYL